VDASDTSSIESLASGSRDTVSELFCALDVLCPWTLPSLFCHAVSKRVKYLHQRVNHLLTAKTQRTPLPLNSHFPRKDKKTFPGCLGINIVTTQGFLSYMHDEDACRSGRRGRREPLFWVRAFGCRCHHACFCWQPEASW
jgi:hypothetical protein